MVQNFREIAENYMNVNFHDKDFVIATFFRDYRGARADNSRCRSVHNSYTWRWLPLQRGCRRIQYKKKEVVWTKVLADLVGNFCSFSESKRTETSSAANQHFVSSYVHMLTSHQHE